MEEPFDAQILPEARRALWRLAGLACCTLGWFVVPYADPKTRVVVLRSFYVGSYGME